MNKEFGISEQLGVLIVETERYQRRSSERQQACSERRYEEKITFPAEKGACPGRTGLRCQQPEGARFPTRSEGGGTTHSCQAAETEEQREDPSAEHVAPGGETCVPSAGLPSTRGIGAMGHVYSRPSTAGTEMQPPSQHQRRVLLQH